MRSVTSKLADRVTTGLASGTRDRRCAHGVPLQSQDVAKAFGGDERGREAFALEHRIGGDRGAVCQFSIDEMAIPLATRALKAPSSGALGTLGTLVTWMPSVQWRPGL